MISEKRPDRWMILEIKGDDPHHRVFGSWFGGYAGANSWQMNSGIIKCKKEDEIFTFYGSSGSEYVVHEGQYGAHLYGMSVAKSYEEEGVLNILSEEEALKVIEKGEWKI